MGKSTIAAAIRYALSRWDGLARFLDDGRIEVDSNVVERSIRPIATNESLYPSSSSVCKHWDLVFWIELIRASFTPHRLDHAVGLEVGGADLTRRARNDLLCGKDAGFDQRSDAVAGDAAKSRGFDHVSASGRPRFARLGLRSSSAARGGWERGPRPAFRSGRSD
jgi:hypothetical protein